MKPLDIDVLKERMQQFGWTQSSLAKEIGLSQRQFERILAGQCELRKPIEKLLRATLPL